MSDQKPSDEQHESPTADQPDRDFTSPFGSEQRENTNPLQKLLDAIQLIESSSAHTLLPASTAEPQGPSDPATHEPHVDPKEGKEATEGLQSQVVTTPTHPAELSVANPDSVGPDDGTLPDWRGETPLYFWHPETSTLDVRPIKSLNMEQIKERYRKVGQDMGNEILATQARIRMFDTERVTMPELEAATSFFKRNSRRSQLKQLLADFSAETDDFNGSWGSLKPRGLGSQKAERLNGEAALQRIGRRCSVLARVSGMPAGRCMRLPAMRRGNRTPSPG